MREELFLKNISKTRPCLVVLVRTLVKKFSLIMSISLELALAPGLTTSPGILIDKFSDHQPYFTSFDLKPLHDSPPKFITISKHSPEALINFENKVESCDLIDKIDISLGGNPNDNYTKLQDILIKLKEKLLPNKTKKFNKQEHKKTPWITQGIIKSINLKNRLYKLLRVTPTNYNKILKS